VEENREKKGRKIEIRRGGKEEQATRVKEHLEERDPN